MPRRSKAALADVVELGNLAGAFALAARGRRHRSDVLAFEADLDRELGRLRRGILERSLTVGEFQRFCVWDPKRRVIHAPCFRERVLHHALMAVVGPALERTLVDDTFACRRGRGPIAAVRRASRHARRFPYVVKADMARYFDSVDHETLRSLLRRRFKDPGLLWLLERVIDAYHVAPGRGLPIGALTSQHFANAYLEPLDRFLLETLRVRGMVRYMDDFLWWCDDKARARETLREVRDFTADRLRLRVKESAQIQRSDRGVNVCGFRVLPSRIRLTKRRKRRYRSARHRWERLHRLGRIDDRELQRGYASALGIVAHADADGFRREELRRRPEMYDA